MPISSITGFLMITIFIYLIMSKRMSAMVGLIVIPVVFALFLGHAQSIGKWISSGLIKVAPTGIMICFAILYFGVMIEAGLFNPLVNKIQKVVGGDPVKVCLGTVFLTAIISLSGDASTTYIVTHSAMKSVYSRLGMNPLILPSIVILMISITNIVPWGGPTSRILAALNLTEGDVFVPLIPGMILSIVWVSLIAYKWGCRERICAEAVSLLEDIEMEHTKQPKSFLANVTLSLILMACIIKSVLPLAILFMIGTGLALLINYRDPGKQQESIAANAANALPVAAMVFAAGIFMGIMEGSQMVDKMAQAIISAIPPSMGMYAAFISALVSLPGTFFLTNDAYYFGVLPVLTKSAAIYGVDPAEMGRAALIGQGCHLLSPLVSSTYLLVGLNKVEFSDLQKYALLPSIGISVIWLIVASALGFIRI